MTSQALGSGRTADPASNMAAVGIEGSRRRPSNRQGLSLTGRESELAVIAGLVGDVADGRGRALLVRGAAGIGKTAMLDTARSLAAERGVRVLWACGVESETEVAFSALRDLLGPVLSTLGALPAPQSAALATALGLAPGVPGDRLAVGAATVGLLEQAASAQPVLVIVDDLPWLDSASRECVVFAARRVAGRLAVVMSSREEALDDLTSGAEVSELVLPRLDRRAGIELVRRAAPEVVPAVAAALADAADGVPLVVLGLVAELDPAQRAGLSELPLPLRVGAGLPDVHRRRLARLGSDTQVSLLVAAAFAGEDLRAVGSACTVLGVDVDSLADAEEAELVHIRDGRLAFVHPLVRGAVYARSLPGQRRAVHAALAQVLRGEARAWHLGLAALGPDEDVARELQEAGEAAMARRGPGPASSAFERAARLSPDPHQCARRLLTAGQAAFAAGMPERAIALLRQAVEAGDDARVRAAAQHRIGQVLIVGMQLSAGIDLLTREAERIRSVDPSLAATMMSEASQACHMAAQCLRALRLAEDAASLVETSAAPEVKAHVAATLRTARLFCGVLDGSDPLIEEADRLAMAIDPLSPSGQSITVALNLRLWTGDFERVRDDSLATCARARETGALSALPMLLVAAAECQYRLGEWSGARSASEEAAALGRELNQPSVAGHAEMVRARLDAACGENEQDCRARVVATVEMTEAYGARSGMAFALAVLGFLELGLSRVAAAIEHLEGVARVTEDSGMEEPTLIPWEADLIEAYLRAGDVGPARASLDVMGRRAARAGTPPAVAAYRRCRGMLAEHFDEHFLSALTEYDQRPMPFERARTLLAYGRRLHRVKRRAEAREVLHEAVSTFASLGAAPWLDQARAELAAAGGRRSTVATTGVSPSTLSPQERRVAETVARGVSNRHAAAALFLSPKTVEFHLVQVYRKLGISSRAQLAEALRAEARL